jgi:ABC-type antimicrobial peptide transport system permease subunit
MTFVILVMVAVIHGLVQLVLGTRLFRSLPKKLTQTLMLPIELLYQGTLKIFDRKQTTIGRAYLIEMSLKMMRVKKTRSIITMGGMALGIAMIVFLVSIGYGLQSVVVNRVVRLNEMRQADVVPGLTPDLALTDSAMSRISQIPNVTDTYPVIAAVGRVEYQDSVSDIALYGVTTEYLTQSAVAPIRGKVFDNNELSQVMERDNMDAEAESEGENDDQVLGVSNENQRELVIGEYSQRVSDAVVEAPLDQWLRIRSGPSTTDPVIGYARLFEPEMMKRVYGEAYNDEPVAITRSGEYLGWWLHGVFELWERSEECQVVAGDSGEGADSDNTSTQTICTPNYSPQLNDDGSTIVLEGYTAQLQLSVLADSRSLSNVRPVGAVLGETTDGSSTLAQANDVGEEQVSAPIGATAVSITGDGSLEMVEIDSGETESVTARRALPIRGDPAREIVVNRALLELIGVPEAEALGLEFELRMVVLGELLDVGENTVESVPTTYTIVGITPESETPIAYVPFIDLRSLGVNRYSQIRVVTNSPDTLESVRATIESLGYATTSVADTVTQIDRLFASLRLLLSVLGMVALSVAALGMFNTLTVSLLERTHEVGLLKALGMSSDEVRELFLTESMIMGFFGGVLGLLIGIFSGKMLGVLLTSVSLSRGGAGAITISQTPISFILVILTISLLIGILTGWYPARRATKISALDALRYE